MANSYITTSHGMSGYYALQVDSQTGEPIQTGIGRYVTEERARAEGREWAASERLEFKE